MVKQSRYTYAETLQHLSSAITSGGNSIFATIDQAAAARSAGTSLRPTTLIVFGNPKGGTPLMDAFPLVGLELPLKLLIWEQDGATSVAYVPMAEIAARYGVTGMDARTAGMDAAVAALVATVAE